MAETRACAECGRTLPADAPAGLCPGCLMGAGLADTVASAPGRPAPEGRQVDDPTFRRAVLELGLVDPAELEWLASGTAGDLSRLVRALIRAGKLTAYQAAALAQGKARGLVIGDYLVLDKLGRGGMGVVFKARHRKGDRVVALKILPPSFARNTDAVKRFRREFEVAARLSHPNVVAAIDAAEDRGVQFLTMEYIEGNDLDEMVADLGPLPLKLALDCTIQAARGLEAAHAAGIVHRDIKPANLIFDGSGQVKVLDLGLARVIESSSPFAETATALTQTGAYMGTVDFIAPEQADDSKRADHRADVYSLGCTLYFLLTARPPFEDETVLKRLMAHQGRPAPSLRARRPEVPAALESTYLAMMAKRPGDRPQSMTEVIAALESCRSSPGDAAEARATLKDFAGRALKRAAPRARGRGTQASIFARRPEGEDPTFDPELRLEDLVMDYREEEHARPLTESQLPPKLPRLASPRRTSRRRAPAGVIAGAVAVLGLGAAGFWLVTRGPSKSAEPTAAVAKAAPPKSAEADAHFRRGVALYDERKYEPAIAELREAVRLGPDEAAAYFYLGRSYHGLSRYDEAVAAHREAIRLRPPYPEAHVRLMRIAIARKRPDEVKAEIRNTITAYREAIRLRPAEAVALHDELGVFLRQYGDDLNGAAVEFREVLRLKPDDFRALDELGGALWYLGNRDEAVAQWGKTVQLHPDNAEGRRDLAFGLRQTGQLDDAEFQLREAIRLSPDDRAAHHDLAWGLQDRGKFAAAEAVFRKWLLLKPDDGDFRYGLARVVWSQKRLDEAEREMQKSIELEREDAIHRYYFALLLKEKGSRDPAIAELREAIRIDAKTGNVGAAVYTLADYLVDLHRPDDAIAVMKAAANLKPDDGQVREKLAALLRSRGAVKQAAGEYDQAIAGFRKTLETKPESVHDLRMLGSLLAKRARWAEALPYLARAYELGPSDLLLALQVGTLYLQMGDDEGYRRHALTVLDRFAAKPEASGYVIKCCLMSPRTIESGRATQIAQDAFNRAKAANPRTDNLGWVQLDLALAAYRSGRFASAAELLLPLRRSTGILRVEADMLRGLAYERMGRKADASAVLSNATRALNAGIEAFDAGNAWHDWLLSDLFRREAEALIRDTAPTAAKGKALTPASGAAPASAPGKPDAATKP